MNTKKELSSLMFSQLENGKFHKAYEEELAFYELVKQGDIEGIQNYEVLNIPEDMEGFGILSDNVMHNLTYHFVILAAMLTRVCIEGSMDCETAFSLSDIYIRTADKCKSIVQLQQLHNEMILDYTMRMKDIYKEKVYSRQVSFSISFIEKSLNKHITVFEIAQAAKINRCYLSRLFKKETGMTVSEYILRKKINVAENMLRYSGKSSSEIAENLVFASQSHFIKTFHRFTGLTPKQFSKSIK